MGYRVQSSIMEGVKDEWDLGVLTGRSADCRTAIREHSSRSVGLSWEKMLPPPLT